MRLTTSTLRGGRVKVELLRDGQTRVTLLDLVYDPYDPIIGLPRRPRIPDF
jgi:hypothetical protein